MKENSTYPIGFAILIFAIFFGYMLYDTHQTKVVAAKALSQEVFGEYFNQYLKEQYAVDGNAETLFDLEKVNPNCLLSPNDIEPVGVLDEKTLNEYNNGNATYKVNVSKYHSCYNQAIQNYLKNNDRAMTLNELNRYFDFGDNKATQTPQFIEKLAQVKADKKVMISEYLALKRLNRDIEKALAVQAEQERYNRFFEETAKAHL